ncbi:type I polyketide synthase [Streptomyces bicolor]|uniref:type I polyketide synthase n=1 Tax=Streptomyces bicolor TaxID=66874 RepID=UPI0006912D81|nr:type I polyketide synthase [Streptomyces bicolor]
MPGTQQYAGPVLLFPGQGGFDGVALTRAADGYPQVRAVFERIDTVTRQIHGRELSATLFRDTPVELTDLLRDEPWVSQLAIYGSGLAAHRVLTEHGVRPCALVGHSLGEITALVAAGGYSVEDGARIVLRRTAAIAGLDGGSGAMVALAAAPSRARHLIALVENDRLAVATENHATQTVLSGPREAIGQVKAIAEQLRIGCAELDAAFAFHNPSLASVAPDFAAAVRDLPRGPLSVPVYSPILQRFYDPDESLGDRLADHFTLPVRFSSAVTLLHEHGACVFVEAGGRATLTSLVPKVLGGPDDVTSLSTLSVGRGNTLRLADTLAELRRAGLSAGDGLDSLRQYLAPELTAAEFSTFWTTTGHEITALVSRRLSDFRTAPQNEPAGTAEPVAGVGALRAGAARCGLPAGGLRDARQGRRPVAGVGALRAGAARCGLPAGGLRDARQGRRPHPPGTERPSAPGRRGVSGRTGGTTSMQDLTGKIALVTGGARNVGKAIAATLADRGAHVLVNYFHSHEQAKETQRELRARGARVDLLRASVARPEQVDRMFAEIEERFGRLDILVNNAANGALVPGSEVTDAHLDKALDTNLKGGLRCARAAAPLMRKAGGGSIVNISALGGSQLVMANYLACAPAKAAVEAAARYLAVEFAPFNIRVNTASAAMLVSEVAEAFPDAEAMQAAIAASTPLGRLGTPEEFAEVVAFLASDRARWITGQVVLADGGLSLGAPLLSPPAGTGAVEPTVVQATAEAEGAAEAEPAAVPAALTSAEADGDTHTDTDFPEDDEIAVVGMGLVVSGADSPERFWQLRTTGRELFVEVPEDRWDRARFSSPDRSAEDKSYQDTCVFITDFEPGRAVLDGLPAVPDETELTTLWLRHSLVQALDGVRVGDTDRFSFHVGYTADGSQHLEEAGVLHAARHLTEDIAAGLDLTQEDRARLVGRVDKVLSGRYHRGATDAPRFLPHQVGLAAMAGVLPDATQLQMVDTACSSSLYAIDIGIKGLLMGKQDIAVCGGAFALAPRGTVLFSKLKGLSQRGAVHALDAEADGVIFADGAGVVVLKRLSRAKADGDRVLGVLKAFGSSSDGKGKAIYAPSSTGQNLAVERALEAGGLDGAEVDWINAHATGTPAGDLAEFTTLREHYGNARATAVTSNKSLIGHTGWAAGVISLIESILALQGETIPGQYRFSSAPEMFQLDRTRLEISGSPRPWPAVPGRARTAAISGFGFGGTNAHLILTEGTDGTEGTEGTEGERGRTAAAARSATDRIAVVGWSVKLPGVEDRDQVLQWLSGDRDIEQSFGEQYPAPPFQQVRMPPATVRTIDRCQLMILACAHDLRDQLGDFWQRHTERTGVVVGHMGPTRAAMLYANRCYLDDIEHALRQDPELAATAQLTPLLERMRERVRSLVPPSNEDSFPGMMPNIISARVANYFDLKGPNITVDAGLASTVAAFATAVRYLRSGELDFVLAGGINGNSLPELGGLLADVFEEPVRPAEGAFLFGLTTERAAREAGLRVLGIIDEADVREAGTGEGTPDVLDCGSRGGYGHYLGAAGGAQILRALQRTGTTTRIHCRENGHDMATHLVVTVGEPARDARGSAPVEAEAASTEAAQTAMRTEAAPTGSAPDLVERYAVTLTPAPAAPRGPVPAGVPDGALILTDRPGLAERLARGAADCTVFSTTPVTGERPAVRQVTSTPEGVRAALDALGRPVRHLVLVTDLTASAPPRTALTADHPGLTALHDLAFLVVQQRYADLGEAPASAVFALLGAEPQGTAHPLAGLFTGLLKCVRLERPDADCFALLTATGDPEAAAELIAAERACERAFPVVHRDGDLRRVPTLTARPATAAAADQPAPLDRESVVVALGGARGITAELLTAVAERYGSRIYALGSNPVDSYPVGTFDGTDEEFAATRARYIREQLAAGGRTVAEINKSFDRMTDARAARRNLDRMARHSGAGRVTYLHCDARDEESVRRALDTVHAAHGRIDLLVNAPGLNRSALIQDKIFDEFRRIRDLKLVAHRNLHRALAGRPPRLWCDFGSLLGYFGQRGEPDYASGNDYLATAAAYAAKATGSDEFVIGWTLWDEVGMGADELTREYFKRAGSYSHMPVAEGVRHFLAELGTGDRTPSLVHMGAAERATVETFYPGYLTERPAVAATAPAGEPGAPARGRFYLRRTLPTDTGNADTGDRDGPGTVRFECPFGLDTDGYLAGHLVRGVPTLPGTFVTEIAAEAALTLVPDGCVVAFEDLRFLHFLQVREGVAQTPKRITARISERVGDLTTVEVSVTHDVIAPSGVLLVSGKPHFTVRVLVAGAFPTAPKWQRWDGEGEQAVVDPYHVPSAPVLLSGPFRATTDTRRHRLGARSVFRPELDPATGPWRQFLMPTVLLDALARTGVLDPVDGLVPVAAPLSIRRIDLYQSANDLDLAQTHGALDLYVTQPGFTAAPRSGNRFVAVAPGGHVVAQMKDVDATVIGYLDPDTGEVRPPAKAPAGAGGRTA